MASFYLDFASLAAFGILTVGVAHQMIKTCQTKSVKDISTVECVARMLACYLLLAKVIAIQDTALIIGQGFFNLLYTAYFVMVLILKYKN